MAWPSLRGGDRNTTDPSSEIAPAGSPCAAVEVAGVVGHEPRAHSHVLLSLASRVGSGDRLHSDVDSLRLTAFVRSVITLARVAYARLMKEMMLMQTDSNQAYRVIISLVASSR